MDWTNITLPDGAPLFEENVRPKIFGYRIQHKKTGNLLPRTTPEEIYSKAAAIRKMNQVAGYYDRVLFEPFDIFDYHLVDIYDIEKPDAYVYMIDKDDFLLE
jgi:hypothetical protein